MAQTTTNYGLLKPESTDSYNHLVYDNPNMDTIDAAMKANADAAISTATCIKSGTTHTITRSNTSAAVFKFTATGDWNTGDTMIVDGVTVSPYLVTGEALKSGAYLINTEVIIALSGTRATVYSNQSEAGTTYFDDANVPFTADNVQDAIDSIAKIQSLELTVTTDSAGRAFLSADELADSISRIIEVNVTHDDSHNGTYILTAKRYSGDSANTILLFVNASFSPVANETIKVKIWYV